jgi:hypothetical protein
MPPNEVRITTNGVAPLNAIRPTSHNPREHEQSPREQREPHEDTPPETPQDAVEIHGHAVVAVVPPPPPKPTGDSERHLDIRA